jgi:hypothetical protein
MYPSQGNRRDRGISRKDRDKDLDTYTLEKIVREKMSGRDLYKAIREVYEDTRKGSIELVDPAPPSKFIKYLLRIDYSLWLWCVYVILALTIITIYIENIYSITSPLRYVLGSIFTLYIPGYVLVEALYPYEKDLKPLERVALSIGLSLAIVPLIGLILNYTPYGIRLNPIIASLSIYTIALSLIAAYRKQRIITIINKSR